MSLFVEGGANALQLPGEVGKGQPTPGDAVVSAAEDFRATPALTALVSSVVSSLPDASCRFEFLNAQGERIGLHVRRGPADIPRELWVPVVVPDGHYEQGAHKEEAEQYRDRIGDRLLRPETVEEGKKHLIADDRQRADRVLALVHNSPLLDVGCSDGTLLLEAVRRWNVSDAVGADVAASALEEGRRALAADPQLQGRVRFVESFIETLDFPDNYFSTITACETLEHVGQGQLAGALANLYRMLRPGGDMIVTVPNRFPEQKYEDQGRARWSWPAHHQFYSLTSLCEMLAPHFDEVQRLSHHETDAPGEGIYLIVAAKGRR